MISNKLQLSLASRREPAVFRSKLVSIIIQRSKIFVFHQIFQPVIFENKIDVVIEKVFSAGFATSIGIRF